MSQKKKDLYVYDEDCKTKPEHFVNGTTCRMPIFTWSEYLLALVQGKENHQLLTSHSVA